MGLSNILALLSGVALFLFGMSLMGDGLKRVAGNKLEIILYRLSGTTLKGVLLGTGVTAVIQSSSATSVMAVGFVNSELMNLNQAVAVIQGSLLGTSITGWVVCLSALEGSGWVSILSTATITAVVAIVGIILRMFSKTASSKHVGDILMGFAVLMFGMMYMSSAVAPLRDNAAFSPARCPCRRCLHCDPSERLRCGRYPAGAFFHRYHNLRDCISPHTRYRRWRFDTGPDLFIRSQCGRAQGCLVISVHRSDLRCSHRRPFLCFQRCKAFRDHVAYNDHFFDRASQHGLQGDRHRDLCPVYGQALRSSQANYKAKPRRAGYDRRLRQT